MKDEIQKIIDEAGAKITVVIKDGFVEFDLGDDRKIGIRSSNQTAATIAQISLDWAKELKTA